eukprot:4791281-Amphidinium_carterae.3
MSHALVQSLIQGESGYDAWRHHLQYFGGTEARKYTTLKSILTPDWGHQNLSAGQLIKQYTHWLQLMQEYETQSGGTHRR